MGFKVGNIPVAAEKKKQSLTIGFLTVSPAYLLWRS